MLELNLAMAAVPPPAPPPPLLPAPQETPHSSKERTAFSLTDEVSYLIQPFVRTTGGERHTKVITFVHNISPVVQNGPMCGFVALSMAAQLLHGSNSAIPDSTTSHPDTLLEIARSRELTKQGEIFSADYLLEVAMHSHLLGQSHRGEVVPASSLDLKTIVCSLINNRAVLVPYDSDKNHAPFMGGGNKAHWCLLVGFALSLDNGFCSGPHSLLECCDLVPNAHSSSALLHYTLRNDCTQDFIERLFHTTQDPTSLLPSLKVFARHGKSCHMGLWDVCSLLESNGGLVDVCPLRTDPEEYVVPAGGIVKGLCSKIVILSQKQD